MLDAHQAATIAFYLGDGEIIHWNCSPILPNEDRQWDAVEFLESVGISYLSRYSIHEIESVKWDELEYSVDFEVPADLKDWGENANVNYTDRTITDDKGIEHNVGDFVDVHCDHCGLRID